MPVSPEQSPRLSTGKKVIFSLVTTVMFFLVLELLLAGCGVRPILYEDDPYVGFSSHIPLFAERTDEDGRIYLTTARNKLKWFNEQQFPKNKPVGGYRIFCLGGSTTYGHPYDDRTSFCGWLREFLSAADSSRQWEVINAGGISYASYREAMLMEELAQYEPDLFVILCGHNEFLEKRTYATVIQMPSVARELGSAMSRTRSYSVLRRLISGPTGRPSEPMGQRDLLPGEVKTLLDDGVGPEAYSRDKLQPQQVVAHFRLNLLRMVDIASSAGASVMFVTPASNLRDCSPFKSEHRSGLTESDEHRWQQLFESGVAACSAGQLEEALVALEGAAAIDDTYAQLQYLRGKTLDGLNRFAEAQQAYLKARDEDICPLRALTPMLAIVTEVAAKRGAALIDFVQLVEQRSDHAIPGENLFLDHVHPTPQGHRLLALAILDQLVAQHVVEPAPSWGEAAIAQVVQRVEGSLDPKAHAIALGNLAKVLGWAGKKVEANRLACVPPAWPVKTPRFATWPAMRLPIGENWPEQRANTSRRCAWIPGICKPAMHSEPSTSSWANWTWR